MNHILINSVRKNISHGSHKVHNCYEILVVIIIILPVKRVSVETKTSTPVCRWTFENSVTREDNNISNYGNTIITDDFILQKKKQSVSNFNDTDYPIRISCFIKYTFEWICIVFLGLCIGGRTPDRASTWNTDYELIGIVFFVLISVKSNLLLVRR